MVPKAVLKRSGLVTLTIARPVNTTQPRTTMNSARPMTNIFNKAHSTGTCPILLTLNKMIEDMLPLEVTPKEGKSLAEMKEDNVNSTKTVNVASPNEVNVVGAKTSIDLPSDPNKLELEDIVYSDDDEDVGAEANMNNLDVDVLSLYV
ncbi:hypothetical protein Tco_1128444 [Tanacetum coccineum]